MNMAPKKVDELIERFSRNIEDYRRVSYKETQVRTDFIDPLFKALGWDIHNQQGLDEQSREVVLEYSQHDEDGRIKAPDYAFMLGNEIKFFVEAKKPNVNLRFGKQSIAAAYQLRSYAWSAKLPLGIVTDFEEMAIYDCRHEPLSTDSADHSRILYLTYTEYAKNWEFLSNLFSPQAIEAGALDSWSRTTKPIRGNEEVDSRFFREINDWREKLAVDIYNRNNALNQWELNYLVQQTIDRIIFLRIAEDRDEEPYGNLLKATANKKVYHYLTNLFKAADDKYNSGLFYFKKEKNRTHQPDSISMDIDIGDAVLSDMIQRLYYPASAYRFNFISTDILGQAYEQFLGKTIRIKDGKAVVEYKPEVKKANGVFYTPTSIVEYMVSRTLGDFLKGKTVSEVSGKLSVLDPACGSGSFLIGAFSFLMDWYLEQYKLDPDKWRKRQGKREARIFKSSRGNYLLKIEEKKRILINHIFGVDIDAQAVEVTKLSLLLKVLEGPKGSTRMLGFARVLPDLANNILCGNSLIKSDYYDGQIGMPSLDERMVINAFQWETEFPSIMNLGGFDVVIGNPPYIDSELMTKYLPETREYCVNHYASATGNWDMFCVFVDRALSLTKNSGYIGMIVPNKLASAEYASGARRAITTRSTLVLIRDYSDIKVFPVAVYPIIYIARSQKSKKHPAIMYEKMEYAEDLGLHINRTELLSFEKHFSPAGNPWLIFGETKNNGIIDKFKAMPLLGSRYRVVGGSTVVEAYQITAHIHDEDSNHSNCNCAKIINSGTIDRYINLWGVKRMRYLGESYIRPVIDVGCITKNREKQARSNKIVIAGMTKNIECCFDEDGVYLAAKSTSVIMDGPELKLLMAILNSKAMSYYYNTVYGGNKLAGGYLRIGPPQIKMLPVPDLSSISNIGKRRLDQMVDTMVSLHYAHAAAKSSQEERVLLADILRVESEIDNLVFNLYGLDSDECRAIMEAGNS
jgi:hypothetical protein